MNVVAVNGGPRKGKISKTATMLEALLDGCRHAGANTEVINLREKEVRACNGCYTCWTKTPGKCVQDDDMKEILEKYRRADLHILATPLYFWGPTALMKNFIDRSMPLSHPFFLEKDGLLTHPPRDYTPAPKVILSVCGFPELDHFEPLSHWFHFMAGRGLGSIVAEIYRPASEFLPAPPFRQQYEEILAATRQAGIELITRGKVTKETLAVIQQDLMDKAAYIKMGNAYFQGEIDRWEAKRASK
ncbi:MAG TPA: flavodoxin family protein [Syntrophomonadaceae bacterium]|nr:flavodoxin family protein [Syntrophomonadaceae bacterium]